MRQKNIESTIDCRWSKTALATKKGNGRSRRNPAIRIAGLVVAFAFVSLFSCSNSNSNSNRIVIPVNALVFLNYRNTFTDIFLQQRWQRHQRNNCVCINDNKNCYYRYHTTPSFVSPPRSQQRPSLVSNLLSAPSDSEFPPKHSPGVYSSDGRGASSDSPATASACDASDEDDGHDSMSDSSPMHPSAEQKKIPAFGNRNIARPESESASKTSERKRYDAELEEAFAQQTRERNPLLGVKAIGVDYGLVRTGVAVTIGYNPEALDVIVTDHPLLLSLRREVESATTDAASDAPPIDEEAQKEEERRLEAQRQTVAEKVVEWASREKADRIVVGLPLHKNGTEAPQTVLTRKFARDHLAVAVLRTLGPTVPVYMSDERYTSKEAAARMRSSSQNAKANKNSNNDLYGLLDAESAKIILEQHYDDHVDRYSARNYSESSEKGAAGAATIGGKSSHPDSHYNGEIVTIPDADLVETLTQEYNERRRLEREKLTADRIDREARARWRKQAMEEDRRRAEEQRTETAANGGMLPSKKKKKKRKKRNRK